MTVEIPNTISSDVQDGGFEVMQADAVLTGRNMGAAAHIAGILTGAQAATVPVPQGLLKDVWPELDPAVVMAIYERGIEVGWRGHQMYTAPQMYGEQLAQAQAQLGEAAFQAMEGMVARSRELGLRGRHPADGEIVRER